MIIKKDFVVLLFPKTGTTFVRKALKKTHEKRLRKWPFRILTDKLGITEREFQLIKTGKKNSVHGNVRDIPFQYCKKEFVSIVRSPISRLLSMYFYQGWLRKPGQFGEKARLHFDSYPNLDLQDYIKYKNLVLRYKFEQDPNVLRSIENLELGHLTVEFIQFYFHHPGKVLANIDNDYISSKAYQKDMAQVNFLKQENLNVDLCNFLSGKNYSKWELETIRNHERENISQFNVEKSKSLWTEEAFQYFRHTERYLFDLLEDLGFNYKFEFPEY